MEDGQQEVVPAHHVLRQVDGVVNAPMFILGTL